MPVSAFRNFPASASASSHQLLFLLSLGSSFSPTVPGPIKDLGNNLIAIPKVRQFERNRALEFEFISTNTNVEASYAHLPPPSSFSREMDRPDFLYGDPCEVQLTLDLIDFEQGNQRYENNRKGKASDWLIFSLNGYFRHSLPLPREFDRH